MSRLALPAARVEMTDLTGLFVCACARGLRALAKPLDYLSSASSCVAGQRPRFEAMQPRLQPESRPPTRYSSRSRGSPNGHWPHAA
jgi:hypothetical protein